ncbi:unnamed protein product [Caenorhabditis sp. 36 PRJEB53466]|nr:unnamed protein product [Caenorhabditis sp. 36 PRJEB53466]
MFSKLKFWKKKNKKKKKKEDEVETTDVPVKQEEVAPRVTDTKRNDGISPKSALMHFGHLLTEYEKKEVLEYKNVYHMGKKSAKFDAPMDADETGFFTLENYRYKVNVGDHIAYRYQLQELVSNQYRAQVFNAMDGKNFSKVTIKSLNRKWFDLDQQYREWNKLRDIQELVPASQAFILLPMNIGEFRNHFFMVFEQFETDLQKYMNEKPKWALEDIATSIPGVFKGLDVLKKLDIIHGNIQPANILLNRKEPHILKICGFGSAIYPTKYRRETQELHYRAPEQFMMGPVSPAMDVWSVGCIMGEMAYGKPFLNGVDDPNQFYAIQETFGIPPQEFRRSCYRAELYFFKTAHDAPTHCIFVEDSDGGFKLEIDYANSLATSDRLPPGSRPLLSFFPGRELALFRNLLYKCFEWMPEKRLDPAAAVKHHFFLNYECLYDGD